MEKLIELISYSQIQQKVKEIAQKIEEDFKDEPLIFIGTLKGAFIFLADLVRSIKNPQISVDFVRVKSYGLSSTSSEEVVITKDVEISIKDKNVILVEDIVDTGYTLKFLVEFLNFRSPKILKVCALIDKKERRKVEVKLDYVGFEIEKGFLVGYGLDYAEKYRHLPGIYEVVFSK